MQTSKREEYQGSSERGFLPRKWILGRLWRVLFVKKSSSGPTSTDVVIGAGDGDLADDRFVEAKRIDGADIADDGVGGYSPGLLAWGS